MSQLVVGCKDSTPVTVTTKGFAGKKLVVDTSVRAHDFCPK
jgi:hypothetical protein